MKKIVISQPMFFPWVGMFEQIKLSDIYIHYNDVSFSKGSMINRVQIKTPSGIKWLTVPLKNLKLGQLIKEVEINYTTNWKDKHLKFLRENYHKAPFVNEMIEIVEIIYSLNFNFISELNIKTIEIVCKYFGIYNKEKFLLSSDLNIKGSSSKRVLDIVKYFNGNIYITGHGAKNYLDHKEFDIYNVRVEYMDYKKEEYIQLYGNFNPYVSILDLIANEGKEGIKYICSGSIYWKDFLHNE